jgi:RHS repeat-associated protein
LTSSPIDDPTCSSSVDSSTTTYTVNAADELTRVFTNSGYTDYSYDLNGNEMDTGITGVHWTYNAQDQADTFDAGPGQPTISMTYTGPGQFERTTAGTASFLSDALGLSLESSGNTYLRGPDGEILGLRTSGPPTTRYYYLLDGLGSVDAVVKDDGTVPATYSYEPFGKLRSSTGTLTNPYRWLGSLGIYADDNITGLYKMGTRWYDPAIGRFTQPDPVPGGGLNRYDYAKQDPINLIDPRGEKQVDCDSRYSITCFHSRAIDRDFSFCKRFNERCLIGLTYWFKNGGAVRLPRWARCVAWAAGAVGWGGAVYLAIKDLRVAYRAGRAYRQALKRSEELAFTSSLLIIAEESTGGCVYSG